MDWSQQTLKRIYKASQQPYGEQQPKTGDAWPYNDGSEADIEEYLHQLMTAFDQSDLISVEKGYDTTSGGYASFSEVFCTKREGSSRQLYLGSGEKVTGILVQISRLAPIAAYGPGYWTHHAHGATSNILGYENINTLPFGDWQGALGEIGTKLKTHGIEMADTKTLNQPIPFEAAIETILNDPPYRVYDLLFHWYD